VARGALILETDRVNSCRRYQAISVATKGSQSWRPTPPSLREPAEEGIRLPLRPRRVICHRFGQRLGHVSVETTERYLGCKQRLRSAVNDHIGLEAVARQRRVVSPNATSRPQSPGLGRPRLYGCGAIRSDEFFPDAPLPGQNVFQGSRRASFGAFESHRLSETCQLRTTVAGTETTSSSSLTRKRRPSDVTT